MKLLSSSALIWSPVVANNRMNRKPQASGINSYEKELGFKPEDWQNNCLQQNGQAAWLDLCCGEGNALLQYARGVAANGQQANVRLKGIDLVDQFQPLPPDIDCVTFETRPLDDWSSDEQYDLVTCIHGLHYVGDKLKVLAAALKAVSSNGLFMANLDLKSIRIAGDGRHQYLRKIFAENDITDNGRRKIISCKGTRDVRFNVSYQGADDTAGPNYTGQEAVDSYYLVK
ncbi:methyltransferase domain-containing protein [Chitinophaga oryzae]|uniref:Methyltransferase domain-containing protein n=1 Tax=Chitinophaga oryzae TaxID=2725414 RepID=A0ABX6LJB8_9BACT|nr:methyltransferase domain-containing protein [Chitinophaga oryzae]QJB40205.1 methyltransferase domain-containing protein [Chitinophaga oryzae]